MAPREARWLRISRSVVQPFIDAVVGLRNFGQTRILYGSSHSQYFMGPHSRCSWILRASCGQTSDKSLTAKTCEQFMREPNCVCSEVAKMN